MRKLEKEINSNKKNTDIQDSKGIQNLLYNVLNFSLKRKIKKIESELNTLGDKKIELSKEFFNSKFNFNFSENIWIYNGALFQSNKKYYDFEYKIQINNEGGIVFSTDFDFKGNKILYR